MLYDKQGFMILFFVLSFFGAACGAPDEPRVETAVLPPAATPVDVNSDPASPTATAPATAEDNGALAYVQNNGLYIQNSGQPPLLVDSCVAEANICRLHYLKWSPNSQYLLYTYYDYAFADGVQNSSLRLVDRQGQLQTVSQAAHPLLPGDWSPTGEAILFLGRWTPPSDASAVPEYSLHEVWTAALDSAGELQPAQSLGLAQRQLDGCGGAGRSPSQVLYENEGGTAYGYLMSVVEWTAPDVLLYTTGCDNQAIGRFDLTTGTQLPPFDHAVRNLVLASDNDQWFGVSGPSWSTEAADRQIVTGYAGETAVSTIATGQPVELVFYGATSNTLYYTTMTSVETHSDLPSGDYFSFNEVSLWQMNLDGSAETMRWEADDQAIAQLSELPNSDLLFVRVENDRDLYQALLDNPTLSIADLEAFWPRRHIVRLAGDNSLQSVVENAGNPE